MSIKILDERVVDQNYNPESENPQSGKAVAEAVSTIPDEIYIGSGDMPEGCKFQLDPSGDVFEIDQTYSPESRNPQSGKAVAEALDKSKLKLIKKVAVEGPAPRIRVDFDKPLKEMWVRFAGSIDGATATVSDAILCAYSANGSQYLFYLGSCKFTVNRITVFTFHAKEIVPYQWETVYGGSFAADTRDTEFGYSIQGLSTHSVDTRIAYSTRVPGQINERYIDYISFGEFNGKYSFATDSYLEIWGVEVDDNESM